MAVNNASSAASVTEPSQHWFTGLADAERTLRAWRDEYNNVRPHSSLANEPPAYSGRGGYFTPSRERIQNSLS